MAFSSLVADDVWWNCSPESLVAEDPACVGGGSPCAIFVGEVCPTTFAIDSSTFCTETRVEHGGISVCTSGVTIVAGKAPPLLAGAGRKTSGGR